MEERHLCITSSSSFLFFVFVFFGEKQMREKKNLAGSFWFFLGTRNKRTHKCELSGGDVSLVSQFTKRCISCLDSWEIQVDS